MDDFISKVFPCLQDNYNYTSAKPNEQKAIEWYRENLEINLDSMRRRVSLKFSLLEKSRVLLMWKKNTCEDWRNTRNR